MKIDTAECEKCHCKGNSDCGHEPINKDWLCTLMPNGLCPCCNYIEQLESALIDLLSETDGDYFSIYGDTELSSDRCKEIEVLYLHVKEKRHG
jgi:hypothetical protein